MRKNPDSLKARLCKTKGGKRLWNQERAIILVTEAIMQLMEAKGVNRAELAQRLGKSRSFVDRLLSGTHDIDIRTISDVFTVLGEQFRAKARPA